jgi:hypothetical protein
MVLLAEVEFTHTLVYFTISHEEDPGTQGPVS